MQADISALTGSQRPVWPREIVDQTLLWLFVAGLAWVPFWYGSNDWIAWGVNALLFPGLAALYELSLLIRRKPHPVGVHSLRLPAVLFAGVVAWIVAQTLTWSWPGIVNPIWGLAAEALGRPVAGSISVNRDLTILALVRLITAASTFWLALQLCRNPVRARFLLGSIGVIGCGYAAYGLIALKVGPLPWLVYLPPSRGYVSATFISRDCYATYAGIGFVVTAGLVLRRYRQEISDAAGSLRLLIASVIEGSGGSGAALLAGAFLTLVALCLTGSRGGLFATGFGLLALLLLGRGRESDRRERLAAIVLPLFLIAVTLLVFGGIVEDKIEQAGLYDTNRMAVYVLTLRSIAGAPVLGYGYGTFVDVFPMYRDRSIDVFGLWAQAHDTYLEVFQGLGLVFGSMLIGCVVILAARCGRGALSRQQNATVPRIAASVTILVGVHALVDFGLQMQAIAITLMAILGAGVAQSESTRVALED
jgi:O-antigen ligase